MEKSYLVQRADFVERKGRKGIDSILGFSYMGSAEYEFGALPESLKKIRERISDYVYSSIYINGKNINTFCHKDDLESMRIEIFALSKGDRWTKEAHCFDSYINNNEGTYYRADFWWDIRNNFMFWKENKEFTKKFKSMICS